MKTEDIFTFGKFKGKSLKEVMAEHGSYVGWCMENVKGFDIEPEELKNRFMESYKKWKEIKKKEQENPFFHCSPELQRIAMIEDWDQFQTCPWN